VLPVPIVTACDNPQFTVISTHVLRRPPTTLPRRRFVHHLDVVRTSTVPTLAVGSRLNVIRYLPVFSPGTWVMKKFLP